MNKRQQVPCFPTLGLGGINVKTILVLSWFCGKGEGKRGGGGGGGGGGAGFCSITRIKSKLISCFPRWESSEIAAFYNLLGLCLKNSGHFMLYLGSALP